MSKQKKERKLKIAMLGHKRVPSREGGIEVVVEELATRMVRMGHQVTCYNRRGHHVSGKNFDIKNTGYSMPARFFLSIQLSNSRHERVSCLFCYSISFFYYLLYYSTGMEKWQRF